MESSSEVAQTTGAKRLMFISRAHHEEVVKLMRQQIADLQCEREEILAKYHELRVSGANPEQKFTEPPKSPLAALGPLTTAALKEMSISLPSTSRRAMEAVVLSLKAEGWPDDQLAKHIRAGEGPRNGNGKR